MNAGNCPPLSRSIWNPISWRVRAEQAMTTRPRRTNAILQWVFRSRSRAYYRWTQPIMTRKELLAKVVKQYLESGDFNGYRVTPDLDAKLIATLISDRDLELHCADRHPNPSIRAFPADAIGEQIGKIHHVDGCLYPTPEFLKQHVTSDGERPFTTMLAQGAAQLEFRAFDLSVLEFYRNDPRYYYSTDDIHGTISVRQEHSGLRDSDQVFLQTFGYCYDEDFNRAVAVFLRYLHDLTPEHQRIWQARLLDRKHHLHPDYYRTSPEHQRIWQARLLDRKHHLHPDYYRTTSSGIFPSACPSTTLCWRNSGR